VTDNDSKIRVGGLYRNTSKDGKTYLTGYLNLRLIAFENQYKRGDKDPDYILYVKPHQPRETDQPAEDDGREIPF